MVIAMSDEEMQIEAILRAKWLANSANDMQACRSEMRCSLICRAWSDGQRWYVMPELENYAGYDRDSRSFVVEQKAKVVSESEGILNCKGLIQSEVKELKANIQKPNLSHTELMLAIAELSEWVDRNPDVEEGRIYEKYNARLKGLAALKFGICSHKLTD